jgi:hypothetical protein
VEPLASDMETVLCLFCGGGFILVGEGLISSLCSLEDQDEEEDEESETEEVEE